MGKFINPFTDFGFKRLFGQEDSKIILIGFLNALFEGEFVVTDLEYRDKEQIDDQKDKRGVIYDIFCKTSDGKRYILEMQNKEQVYFEDRALYYASRGISKQGQKGVWNFQFDAVLGIYLLNFTKDVLQHAFRSDFGIRRLGNDEPGKLQVLTDKLRMVFLQMPLFDKKQEDCKTNLDRWTFIMKNMDTLNDIPWREQEEAFNAIAEIANLGTMTEEEQNRYDDALRELWDAYATYECAREEGKAEGKVEGKAEVALSLIGLNVSDEIICQSTGLSLAEIQKLKCSTDNPKKTQ